MNKTEFFMDLLQQEGFRPTLDDDGDVTFKFEGRPYYLLSNEHDLTYYTLLRSGFWHIESAEELQRALLYASEVSRETKVAKVYVNYEQTYANATAELFYAEPEHFALCFMRALTSLQYAVGEFSTKMRQSAPPPDSHSDDDDE